jgi:predicted heme/steroid binding protein/uncharacterized membrane protein
MSENNTEQAASFSATELAKYDGQDGRRAYVAYKGDVYDVTDSKLWRNGRHVKSHYAGKELTPAMADAPHGEEVMVGFKIVGKYTGGDAADAAAEPKPAAQDTAPAPEGDRRFTAEELAEFDGKEGRAAYVCYKGKVYDVTSSKLWRNGMHVRAHAAGEDLSGAMLAAPHDGDVMERFPVVGLLIDAGEDEDEQALPWWAQFSLDHHLHPIAVHFPTGLGATAPVFAIASLFFHGTVWFTYFQAVAFWNIVVCLLASIPAVLTGILSWYYNYAAVMTPIYRAKWGGSVVLLAIGVVSMAVWLLGVGSYTPALNAPFWIYMVLLVAHAPVVAYLGHYGGKITFPS